MLGASCPADLPDPAVPVDNRNGVPLALRLAPPLPQGKVNADETGIAHPKLYRTLLEHCAVQAVICEPRLCGVGCFCGTDLSAHWLPQGRCLSADRPDLRPTRSRVQRLGRCA